MPISQVLYKRKNGLARYDPKKKAYVGYRIDVVVNGKRHRDGGFASRRDAELFIDRLKGEARDRRNGLATGHAPRVSELLKKRLDSITYDKKLPSRVFETFKELLDGDPRVTEIRSSHFQRYVNSRNKSPGTIRRELNELSAAFHAGPILFPEELDSYAPPKIPRPKKPKPKPKHVITKEEKDAIVSHLPPDIARMFAIAWYLGLRKGELKGLRKDDLKGRTLRVVRWKTGDVTLFEDLPDEILKILKEAMKASKTEHIFPHLWAKQFYPPLRKAVEAAGLPYGRAALGGLTLHSNRHSFVTRATEVGDLATARDLAAHSDETMTAYYSHSTRGKRKDLIRRMYGDNDLRAVYDKIRNGSMTFEEFKKALK